jgi:hypothetical protein
MDSVLDSGAIDYGLDSQMSHTEEYEIGICCF